MIKDMSLSAQREFLLKGKSVVLPLGKHKQNEKTLSAMIAAPLIIGTDGYIGVVLIRQYASGNKKLYVNEVFLKQKLLDDGSNPAHVPATNQGVISESYNNKGNIVKILQKIISAKFD
jgi:hypothetical protein